MAEARRPREGQCVSRADLEHARGPARVREDRAGIRPVRVFDENDARTTTAVGLQVVVRGAREAQPPGEGEEFARAPRPAAASSGQLEGGKERGLRWGSGERAKLSPPGGAGRARSAGGRETCRPARGPLPERRDGEAGSLPSPVSRLSQVVTPVPDGPLSVRV
jgi:hypothetical protein